MVSVRVVVRLMVVETVTVSVSVTGCSDQWVLLAVGYAVWVGGA